MTGHLSRAEGHANEFSSSFMYWADDLRTDVAQGIFQYLQTPSSSTIVTRSAAEASDNIQNSLLPKREQSDSFTVECWH
jgi:hypothetical protein